MIINIRGTSGSGKSTLVHRFLTEYPKEPVLFALSDWKKPKIVAYKVLTEPVTYVIGRYETQCGGCDSMSYKGSHDDIEEMVRSAAGKGNVIFEGLTISSTITRWMNVSKDFPGQYIWAFMDTPVEECHRRILARSGREPKVHSNGLADYQIKHAGCIRHIKNLSDLGEQVIELSSDDAGYQKMLSSLKLFSPAKSL